MGEKFIGREFIIELVTPESKSTTFDGMRPWEELWVLRKRNRRMDIVKVGWFDDTGMCLREDPDQMLQQTKGIDRFARVALEVGYFVSDELVYGPAYDCPQGCNNCQTFGFCPG